MKIIAELLAGIDPTTTDLINDNIARHWLTDENDNLRLTHFDETITNDYWNPDTNILRIQDLGTGSLYWTLDGGNILRINT